MARLEIPEIIETHSVTECHVTPKDESKRMVKYLGGASNKSTLEPQAGTGNLLQALFDAGQEPGNIVAIEKNINLCATLNKRFENKKGFTPLNDCFLSYADEVQGGMKFQRILCNPPFKKVKAHIKAALSLLDKNGVLVALVPVTYQHEDAEELEILSNETFRTAKVYTKIIRIIK
ncbi:MAG: RsmD family RNA methyltransferase [Colwellia sp.]